MTPRNLAALEYDPDPDGRDPKRGLRLVEYDFTDPNRSLGFRHVARSLDTEALLSRQDRQDDAWIGRAVRLVLAVCLALGALAWIQYQGVRAAENVRDEIQRDAVRRIGIQ